MGPLNKKQPGYLNALWDFGSWDTVGVKSGAYALWPSATPKYDSQMGRNKLSDLTVARLYLSGGNYEVFEGINAAHNFSHHSYVGFFLQEVTERSTEKSQIIPMNGDGYAAFFSGQEPSVYSFSGVLLNTQQDQWRSTMSHLYQEVFRGSKAAGMNRMVQIAYDDKVVSGSMLNLTQVLTSSPDETHSKFTFDILVAAVHDMWAVEYSDSSVTAHAFLGEKTIFPDVAGRDSRKGLRDFTRTAYLADPPKRTEEPGGGKCSLQHIRRNLNGARTQAIDSTIDVSALRAGCLDKKRLAAIRAEIEMLSKRGEESKDSAKKKEYADKIARLKVDFNTLTVAIKQGDRLLVARLGEALTPAEAELERLVLGAEDVVLGGEDVFDYRVHKLVFPDVSQTGTHLEGLGTYAGITLDPSIAAANAAADQPEAGDAVFVPQQRPVKYGGFTY